MARMATPEGIETIVLTKCARRCALCFGLNGDLNLVRGQIAHIDRNRQNSTEANLCYLCVTHHAEYDSFSRQVKGLKPAELAMYKARLEGAISDGKHTSQQASLNVDQRDRQRQLEHDRNAFLSLDEIMSEPTFRDFVGWVVGDHSYRSEQIEPIDRAFESMTLDSGAFIDPDVERARGELRKALGKMCDFLALNFFVVRNGGNNHKLCLYPDLCCDRGNPTPQDAARYDQYAATLSRILHEAIDAYQVFRRTVKQRLLI